MTSLSLDHATTKKKKKKDALSENGTSHICLHVYPLLTIMKKCKQNKALSKCIHPIVSLMYNFN